MSSIQLDIYEKELISWSKEIIAYLMKSGARQEDAQDVTQDVFVKLLESEIVLPASKLRAWMYRTAVRKYIDKYRRDKRYLEILQQEFFAPTTLTIFDQDDYEWLRESLTHLSQSQSFVMELYYFQGFSIKEIATILGYSQSKVKVDLMRGRHQLKEYLEKAGITHEDFR